MNAISRYYTLATVSGVLTALLLVAAVLLRVFAFVSGVLVLLLLAATIYFLAKGSALRKVREHPPTHAT